MTKIEMAKKLGELKPKADELGNYLIDEICELINLLPEDKLKKTEKSISLIENCLYRESRIENVDAYLESIHTELKKQLEATQQRAKEEALGEMRKRKKKGAVWVIVILAVVTGAVLALGILSALELISGVWCNVIGVLDCVFGLSFFIYEYCDDKLNEASISAGDAEVIKKYCKGTGDISNTGKGSFNSTGKVKAKNIIVANAEKIQEPEQFIDELFKK